jgi:demethylmenaquinone methyltransferase/2-methoxy-6-polyprenyl-1,4-benzoquinol methylase
MTDHAVGRQAENDVYDWWSRHPRLLNAFYTFVFFGREASIRRRAVDALALAPGDRVLELGSGPGNGLDPIRDRVGDDGLVVGVDASRGMTRRAADRVRDHGWENVHVVRGDATRLGVRDEAFDAVYAAMSLSAMPEPLAGVAAAHDALRPGGRLVVLDAQPFQQLPFRLVNPVLVPLFERLTDWMPDVDLPAGIDERFAETTVETYTDGTLFVASATKGTERR